MTTQKFSLRKGMRYFTSEEVEQLSKYEKNFTTVIDYLYLRALTAKGMSELQDVYVNAGGDIRGISSSCYSCLYKLCEKVGALWRASKEQLEQQTFSSETSDKSEKSNKLSKKRNNK